MLALAASGGVDIPRFFLALATILVVAKLLGELAERVGQPAVLGELVAGVVLGWNFGDGHLHSEDLLAAVQAQCGFEPGELRCIFVESQPALRQSLAWRIVDAATGHIAHGELDVRELQTRQPWSAAP